jgi:HTH-type transcriptional regulator, sugar sensing transcriptional regulator
MIDIKIFLSQLGLTEKESQLYITALKYGPQTASTIATKTGIARSTVNFLFKELIKKGFASKENREKTTYYFAVHPESIEHMLQERRAETKKLENDFQYILPFLKGMQSDASPIPKVRYFEGLKGLYRTIDDVCESDQTVRFISSHNNMHPQIREYIENIYLPQSKQHKNKNQMIINEGTEARKYVQKANDIYEEIIFMDPKNNPFKLTTAIYGNKTAFISYDPEDMSGFIIENKLLTEHMKTIFERLKISAA